MINRELYFKEISNWFAVWETQLLNLSGLNLLDANLFSENMICDILNLIYDYKLLNVNSLVKNHPAIDLVDDRNRVAVQVTSDRSKSGIQMKLNRFFQYELHKKYDKLLFVILGKKQKSYSEVKVQQEFDFNVNQHVLDFKAILNEIYYLSAEKVETIAKLLSVNTISGRRIEEISVANKLKRNLALKKKMKKDFLRRVPLDERIILLYWPSHGFEYHEVIVRSFDDKSSLGRNGRDWFKAEVWNFYDNGIELITIPSVKVIVDRNGFWDVLDYRGDTREENPNYMVLDQFVFYRIPYDFIVEYDLESDSYSDCPYIYVDFANNGRPYEEIIIGDLGNYDPLDRSKCKRRKILDNAKRKILD